MTQSVQVRFANVAVSAFYLTVDHCAAGVFLLPLLTAPGLGQSMSRRNWNTWDEATRPSGMLLPKESPASLCLAVLFALTWTLLQTDSIR